MCVHTICVCIYYIYIYIHTYIYIYIWTSPYMWAGLGACDWENTALGQRLGHLVRFSGTLFCGKNISCQPPPHYAERMRTFADDHIFRLVFPLAKQTDTFYFRLAGPLRMTHFGTKNTCEQRKNYRKIQQNICKYKKLPGLTRFFIGFLYRFICRLFLSTNKPLFHRGLGQIWLEKPCGIMVLCCAYVFLYKSYTNL